MLLLERIRAMHYGLTECTLMPHFVYMQLLNKFLKRNFNRKQVNTELWTSFTS